MSKVRPAYNSEMQFFEANPNVGGMATEDNRVALNPYSNLSPMEKQAVVQNEMARLMMRSSPAPQFAMTPEQQAAFAQYGPELAQKETIAARLLSGDPSAGAPTPEQKAYVGALKHKQAGTMAPGAEKLGQFEYERLRKYQDIMKNNAHIPWVQRAMAPNVHPVLNNKDGSVSTHRMAAEVDDKTGVWYVFPTIVSMPGGKLKEFTDPREALNYNRKIGNAIPFENKDEAIDFSSKGYKEAAGWRHE